MILKWTVSDLTDMTLGLRWRPDDMKQVWGTLEVCGFGRHLGGMESLIEQTLGKVAPEPYWPQHNKCRITVRCRLSEIREALRKLEEAGMIVEQVRSLGRLVR